jgi:hypothetical protein
MAVKLLWAYNTNSPAYCQFKNVTAKTLVNEAADSFTPVTHKHCWQINTTDTYTQMTYTHH